MESNNYLASLINYIIEQLEWSKDKDESDEELQEKDESEEWEMGDEQVVCELDRTIIPMYKIKNYLLSYLQE